MRLSISYSGFGPIQPMVAAVRAAERAGLDGVWTAEHVGFHDAVVPSACFLSNTERIEIGIVGAAPVSRHPGLLAMELASLAELGPGRVRIQVGLGDQFLIGRIGGRFTEGLRQVEEFVDALRHLFAGKQLNGTYCGHRFDGYQIASVDPAPAIDVMALRPRMLAMAARIADGVSLSSGASLGYLTQAVRDVERVLAETGRQRSHYRITAMALGAIAPQEEAAAALLTPVLGLFSPGALGVLAPEVFDPQALASVAGDPGGVGPLLTPQAVARLGVVATPESLPNVLASYAATGIDELSINLINPPAEIPELLPALAAARPR